MLNRLVDFKCDMTRMNETIHITKANGTWWEDPPLTMMRQLLCGQFAVCNVAVASSCINKVTELLQVTEEVPCSVDVNYA